LPAAAGKTILAEQPAAERHAVRLTKDEWLWALDASPWDEQLGNESNNNSGALLSRFGASD
jgi:predicted kinase